jgi:transposase
MDALLPVVLAICCGIDVHKKTLTACLLKTAASGEALAQRRVFRTVTSQLQELAAWLVQEGCRHVAIESTGVYWKPVFNVLEKAGIEVVLVNAQHVKNVPGRKTDVKDAEWLATLLRVGLLRSSFVPPQEIRELRDLTRYRTQVVRQRADECNRIQKLLENCNIKLASVASNVLGASGRDMLRALGEGLDNPGALANLARGKLRDKLPELEEALRGVMSETQRWLLREQLHKVGELDEAILRLDAKVAELCLPFAQVLALLDQIPGVNQRVAQVIVAEIGLDMSRFKSAALSGQPRERRQAEERQGAQGEPLAAAGAGGSGLGIVAHQGDESVGDVSAAQGASRGQAGVPGGGAPHLADGLHAVEPPPALRRGRPGLLPCAGQGPGQGETGAASAEDGLCRDGDGCGASGVSGQSRGNYPGRHGSPGIHFRGSFDDQDR